VTDRLRSLWDFDDLDGTEQRLTRQLEHEGSDSGRAEVLTQLARVEGLRGEFAACERLLEEAEPLAGTDEVACARIDLERGRMLRSSGDLSGSLPLFESAFAIALAAGEDFIAIDAAHMAALAAGDREGFSVWTRRGIDLARSSGVSYWLGPLYNNLGWEHYEAREFDAALEAFERALDARERDPERPDEAEIARYCVGKTLRALGRADEAAALLERCVASRPGDSYFHEELAESYALLGRTDDARAQAELALGLLEKEEHESERASRLGELARA
jgi:tetratricopeptide (TPR) repeat protein